MGRRLVLVLMVIALSGCATSDHAVERQARPLPKTGYVAGKFTLERYPFVIAFVLSDGKTETEYLLPFTAKRNFDNGNEETTLVALPPGTYSVKQWILFNINFGPMKVWGRDITADMRASLLTRPIEVREGEVMFLGAFVGNTVLTRDFTKSTISARWTARPVTVDEAKRLVAVAFPNFAGAPLHCMACSEE